DCLVAEHGDVPDSFARCRGRRAVSSAARPYGPRCAGGSGPGRGPPPCAREMPSTERCAPQRSRAPCRRSATRTGCVPGPPRPRRSRSPTSAATARRHCATAQPTRRVARHGRRSEEHTSELQSRENLVCRLLLEKKKRLANKTHKV